MLPSGSDYLAARLSIGDVSMCFFQADITHALDALRCSQETTWRRLGLVAEETVVY
jgi:hypothetical protein